MKNDNFKNSIIYKFSRKFTELTGYRISKATLLLDIDDKKIIEIVDQRTMTGSLRLANLCEAVKYLNKTGIQGDFVECGVWRGGSVMAMALKSLNTNHPERIIWLFDTFSGMTDPSESDFTINDDVMATALMKAEKTIDFEKKGHVGGVLAYASRSDVEAGLIQTGYPMENFRIVQGDVRSTMKNGELPESIALLRLDTDFYDSTLITLQKLWPRLTTGGVLIIDDYDHWGGARKAVDEFFNGSGPMLMRMDTGRIAIKSN